MKECKKLNCFKGCTVSEYMENLESSGFLDRRGAYKMLMSGSLTVGDKKRRKGQKKPDGTTAEPKPTCPVCGKDLKRNYSRESIEGKQRFVKAGWRCSEEKCSFITKEDLKFEEKQDETESFNEMESD